MLILIAAHHSERDVARRVATRLRMVIPLPSTHLVKATDGRVEPDFVTALDAADRTLLLVSASNTSLRTAQRLVKFTSSIGVGADRLHVVAQGLRGAAGIGARELGEMLQREIYWELPPDESPAAEQDAYYAGLATKLGLRPEQPVSART